MAVTMSVSIGRRQFDRSSGRCEGECRLRRLSLTNDWTSRLDESATVGESDGERDVRQSAHVPVGKFSRLVLADDVRGSARDGSQNRIAPRLPLWSTVFDAIDRIGFALIENEIVASDAEESSVKVASSSSCGSRRRAAAIPDRVAAICHLLELIFASVALRKVCDMYLFLVR